MSDFLKGLEDYQRRIREEREHPTCDVCGEKHSYPHPIVRETVYLPMDCPNCGRHRLEFDGYHVVCEKCGCADWEHPSRNDPSRAGETKMSDSTKQCGSCGAPIYWLKNAATGKVAPIDAKPSEQGNIRLHPDSAFYQVLPVAEASECNNQGVPLHTSHFATCPQARSWRSKNR